MMPFKINYEGDCKVSELESVIIQFLPIFEKIEIVSELEHFPIMKRNAF